MSNYVLGNTQTISIGWDVELDGYYAIAHNLDDGNERADIDDFVITHDVDELIGFANQYAPIPETLREQLLEDRDIDLSVIEIDQASDFIFDEIESELLAGDNLDWQADWSDSFDLNNELGVDIDDSGMEL